MCIASGPIAPQNTVVCVIGLKEGVTKDRKENVSQVELLYINDLAPKDKDAKESRGGVLIVPVAITCDVLLEKASEDVMQDDEDNSHDHNDNDVLPFFVDINGENVVSVARAVNAATKPPNRDETLKFGSKRQTIVPMSSNLLEVVELKQAGYNVSFAMNIRELRDKVDVAKLNIDPSEWKAIYENTELRFGGNNKDLKEDSKKGTDSSYGFVVAVPRKEVKKGEFRRTGFGLVYWTKKIEFPTVHEQLTKTSTPIQVEMDVTLVGINVAVLPVPGISHKHVTDVKYLVDEGKRWNHLAETLQDKSCRLPTHGILHGKPKPISPYQIHFVSYLNLQGPFPNINISGVFIPKSLIEKMRPAVEASQKSEDIDEILGLQSSLKDSLKLNVQRLQEDDLRPDDQLQFVSYQALQMVISSFVQHACQK